MEILESYFGKLGYAVLLPNTTRYHKILIEIFVNSLLILLYRQHSYFPNKME